VKSLSLFSKIFLATVLLGWALFSYIHTGDSEPDEIIKPTPLLIKRQILFPEPKEPLPATLGKRGDELILNGLPSDREKKVGPSASLMENEKSRKEPLRAAVNPILVAAGIPAREIPSQSNKEWDDFLEEVSEVSKRRDTDDGNGLAQEIFFSTLMPDLKTGASEPMESFSPRSIRIFAILHRIGRLSGILTMF